jgi:hypothetical protein
MRNSYSPRQPPILLPQVPQCPNSHLPSVCTLTSPASHISITSCPASFNLLRLAPHQLMSGMHAGGGDVSKESGGGIAVREEWGALLVGGSRGNHDGVGMNIGECPQMLIEDVSVSIADAAFPQQEFPFRSSIIVIPSFLQHPRAMWYSNPV